MNLYLYPDFVEVNDYNSITEDVKNLLLWTLNVFLLISLIFFLKYSETLEYDESINSINTLQINSKVYVNNPNGMSKY